MERLCGALRHLLGRFAQPLRHVAADESEFGIAARRWAEQLPAVGGGDTQFHEAPPLVRVVGGRSEREPVRRMRGTFVSRTRGARRSAEKPASPLATEQFVGMRVGGTERGRGDCQRVVRSSVRRETLVDEAVQPLVRTCRHGGERQAFKRPIVEGAAIGIESKSVNLWRRGRGEQREVAELVLRVADLHDEMRLHRPQMPEDSGRDIRVDLGVVLSQREA